MLRMTDGDTEGKIRKLMDYTARGGDVADPWYTAEFGATYRDIHDGCAGLQEAMLQEDRKFDYADM